MELQIIHEEASMHDEARININHFHPGAIITLFITMLFWAYLDIFILPVQEAYIAQHKIEVSGVFSFLFLFSDMVWSNFWIIPLLLVAIFVIFEKFQKSHNELLVNNRKILITAVNTVFILITGVSLALSALFFPHYLVK